MSKHDLISIAILFVLWLESSFLLAMLVDEIHMAFKKRKLLKQIRADVREAINNNFKEDLKALQEEANDER